jgi:hypothetical protein
MRPLGRHFPTRNTRIVQGAIPRVRSQLLHASLYYRLPNTIKNASNDASRSYGAESQGALALDLDI